jgi:protocatechuate 3,4-dioxygenase beta subunit
MLTRRDMLQKCAALGSIVIASQFYPEALLAAFQESEKQLRKPTPRGYYDLEGYRYRGKANVDKSGTYRFESVIPGHYPDKSRVCQHVHYLVQAPGYKPLVTQLYFATDPVFEGDPAKNYARDPLLQTPELIRPVMLTGEPNEVHAKVQFELCIERL